ncbi:MAG: molecular chaperone HscC [Clostridiales bacterium]|nr:molecular chaperone HscC [Clostridiales bacterium]
MPIIGIDLGTTNSLASCFIDNECVVIPNALGDRLTPSVVSVLENGEIAVGKIAKERLITNPQATAEVFKRYMGSKKAYQLESHSFLPQELSSFVLKSLKADAEAYLKTSVEEAVISVPAYFNDHQRKATIEAGKLAGLKVERLISEPTAAAVAYGITKETDDVKFLIFDLGGGTFDVSIVEWFSGILEIRAVAGDNFLGGEDFNDVLRKHFMKECYIDGSELSLQEESAMKKMIESAKLQLSSNPAATLKGFYGGEHRELIVSSDEFQRLSEDLFCRLRRPLQRALKDSKLKTTQLERYILVGGATKMPMIRSYLAKISGKFPVNSINPEEVVAIGAGFCAAMKERNEALKENILTDVCPYTLGTEVSKADEYGGYSNGHFMPIIERNTIIPCSRSDKFVTMYDNQSKLNVGIYQGEHRLASENIYLGELTIEVPPAPKGQSWIDVRYTYDINGILEVEVKSSIEMVRKVIVNSDLDMTKEEIEERLKKLKDLKIHPRDQQKNRYLLEWGDRLFQESLGDIRKRISDLLQRFTAVLERQNPDEIREAAASLESFFKGIDAKLF